MRISNYANSSSVSSSFQLIYQLVCAFNLFSTPTCRGASISCQVASSTFDIYGMNSVLKMVSKQNISSIHHSFNQHTFYMYYLYIKFALCTLYISTKRKEEEEEEK